MIQMVDRATDKYIFVDVFIVIFFSLEHSIHGNIEKSPIKEIYDFAWAFLCFIFKKLHWKYTKEFVFLL